MKISSFWPYRISNPLLKEIECGLTKFYFLWLPNTVSTPVGDSDPVHDDNPAHFCLVCFELFFVQKVFLVILGIFKFILEYFLSKPRFLGNFLIVSELLLSFGNCFHESDVVYWNSAEFFRDITYLLFLFQQTVFGHKLAANLSGVMSMLVVALCAFTDQVTYFVHLSQAFHGNFVFPCHTPDSRLNTLLFLTWHILELIQYLAFGIISQKLIEAWPLCFQAFFFVAIDRSSIHFKAVLNP